VSRNVSRSTIRARATQLANVQNDPSFTVAEVNDGINLHMPAVYDFLVAAGPPDYYAADYTFSVSSGIIPYQLPDDFLSAVNFWVLETDQWYRPLDTFQDRMRQAYRGPAMDCTVIMEYIPICPVFDQDADTFDGVDGWEELIAARVARDILVKREGDVTAVLNIMAAAEKRLRAPATQRKRGGPKYLIDVEADMGWPYRIQLDAYRLRGANVEFYSNLWGPFV
jgi:hypothetical protein